MPAGVQIIGDSGVIQIDQNYFNVELQSKQTISTIAGEAIWQAGQSRLVVTTNINTAPYVAIKPIANEIGLWRSELSGSTLTLTYFCQAPIGTQIQVYFFGNPSSSPSNFGLQVFNELGELTYDSNRKYARVLLKISGNDDVDEPVNYPLPSGKEYAVLQGVFSGEDYTLSYSPGMPGNDCGSLYMVVQDIYILCFRAQGSGITLHNLYRFGQTFCAAGADVGPYSASRFEYLVFDVTNY